MGWDEVWWDGKTWDGAGWCGGGWEGKDEQAAWGKHRSSLGTTDGLRGLGRELGGMDWRLAGSGAMGGWVGMR